MNSKAILALVVLISMPISYIIRGFVLSTMWEWFMVPLGLIQIGKAHAIGIAAIVSMMTYTPSECKDDRDASEKYGSYLGVAFLGPLLVLLVGYVIKQFM